MRALIFPTAAVAIAGMATGVAFATTSPRAADRPPSVRAPVHKPSAPHSDGLGLGPFTAWSLEVRANGLRAAAAAQVTERARQAAAARAAARAATAHQGPVSSGGQTATVTGSCAAMKPSGFPDWIIQRESRGDPNARNASGAFGCAQLMPMHLHGDYAADWARLWNNGAGACNWVPPNYCAGR